MNVQKINNTNFKAIPLANVRVKGVNKAFKLYEVSRRDREFLEDFYDSLDLVKLMPGLSDNEYTLWDGIVQSAIDVTGRGGRQTILETCDNIPCGLLNYSKYADKFHLNYIATVPIEPKQKVPFAGQILFNEFFKRVLNSSINNVELNALRESPFSPITKYIKLGFKPLGGDSFSENMKIFRDGINDAITKQNERIIYTKAKNHKNVELSIPNKIDKFLRRLFPHSFDNL